MHYRKLFDLTGQVALITGGAGALGSEMARGLAQYGCDIVVVDLQPPPQGLAQEIRQEGRDFFSLQVDITQEGAVISMLKEVLSRKEQIHILVNGAGVNKRMPVTDCSTRDWDHILSVNLRGTFLVSREVAREMKGWGQGKIINLGSVSSLLGHPHHGPYAASKGGVLLFTRVLAVEMAPYGVQVNAIGPAYIETELTRDYLDQGDHRAQIQQTIPMGRLGRPEDVVGALLYLASPASNFVSGTILMVDGGRTAD